MISSSLLTITILFPLLGALVALVLKKEKVVLVKWATMIASVITFALSLVLYLSFDPSVVGFQFVERALWVEGLQIHYHVGIDGMSLLLIMLTTFLTPLALLGTWNSITHRLKEYSMMVLLLEVGMLGVFAALDLFLFYVFWEAMLIPMCFLIGIWGGKERVYAAVKFFLFTLFGSLLMLVGILSLLYSASLLPGGVWTTDLTVLMTLAPRLSASLQLWMFLAFALSFAIKVPVFPLHTWLPDAHVQAPTAGSVILAGVLLKMGTYGFVRFCLPLFPDAALKLAPYISTLAVIGIVYGGLVSMVQTDIKKLVAYSSVSHLGFVVLGIFAITEEGMQGAIIQMINHGLSTGALFLIVGMLYDRAHTRMISDFGGVAKVMPVFATIFFIVGLSSIGLPGLNGFVGEFLVLLGAYKSAVLGSTTYAVVAALGVIIAAVYILWMYQRVMLGPVRTDGLYNGYRLVDLSKREIATLVPILIFIVWIGVYPSTFLKQTAPVAREVVNKVEQVMKGGTVRTAEVVSKTSSPRLSEH
jgi:NADH-quinone oxidoreductase subunit M